MPSPVIGSTNPAASPTSAHPGPVTFSSRHEPSVSIGTFAPKNFIESSGAAPP